MSTQASTDAEISCLESEIKNLRDLTNGPGADTSKLHHMANTFKLRQRVRALTKDTTFDPE
jgi:hypothetical protein